MKRVSHAVIVASAVCLGAFSAAAQTMEELARFVAAQTQGDVQEAATLARELLSQEPDALVLEAEERFELHARLSEALAQAGDLDGAVAGYEAVLSDRAAIYGENSLDLVDTLTRLAELLRQTGELEAADDMNDRAIAILKRVLGVDHPRLLGLVETRADLAAERLAALRESSPSGGEAQETMLALRERVRSSRLRRSELIRTHERAPGEADDTLIVTGGARDGATRSLIIGDRAQEAGGADDEPPFEKIQVFYGTSRERTDSRHLTEYYSGERAGARTPEGLGLETGIVTVSVPTRRELGAIPKPRFWRGEFRPDPTKHVILENIEHFEELREFTSALRARVTASDRREAFVYIHGFNNNFAKAAERTAQLAADLELDGAPIMYSWPSRGDVLSYFADANDVIRPVVDDLEAFLMLIANEAGADRLHVVAHSMGNRYLLSALEEIVDERSERAPAIFDELVFAAPDVDADDFSARLPDVTSVAERMTLYASENDRALQVSKMLNGGYRRAGDASSPLVLDALQTIDTSPAPNPPHEIGHSDVFEFALNDFRSVVWFSLSPNQRCILEGRDNDAGEYWEFSVPLPAVCDADLFREAIVRLRRLGPDRTLQLLQDQVAFAEEGRQPEQAGRWRAVLSIVEDIADDL